MPAYTCPHCQKPFSAPASTTAAKVRCPHCRHGIVLPKPAAPRWFYARAKRKYGPYTWQQLRVMADRGDLRADDMLLQEGTKHWIRASVMTALFPEQNSANAGKPSNASHRPLPWLIAGLASAVASLMLGAIVVGHVFFFRDHPADPPHGNIDKVADNKKDGLPKKNGEEPKNDGAKPKVEVKKKTPEDKKPQPRAEWAGQFVEQLNRQRSSAGLGRVALDADLSAGCAAHAKYLAEHLDPAKADPSNVYDEDPKKPGYTIEGQRAGQNGMIALGDPPVALERWMGRLSTRASLLAPEMQTVGLGFAANARGHWICVVDPLRGRGEPIIVYPAPKQLDVPISFTGGPEVPDAKAAAGFPITVTFPIARQITDGKIELRDDKDKALEGWAWESPKKPSTIALIPKGLLRGLAVYHVKASAQVDGKPWSLAWSFTTADDGDRDGAWAKKALAKLNAYRAHAGLAPVIMDKALNEGCVKHARYLVINEGHPALQGLSAHDENLDLPGASQEGKNAGLKSNIAMGDYEPTDGIDAWMATLYHRVPMLEPNLKTIGFGCVCGQRQGWVAVMDVSSGRGSEPRHAPVFYPAPDQADVRLNFPNGGEEPNPIPEDKTGRAGYPITAFFPRNEPVQAATGKLTDAKGVEVACWFSSLEKAANPKFAKRQGNTVCLIPRDPLIPNTVYHVRLQGQRGGQAWEKKWKFTTGDGGLTVAAAKKTLVEHFNHYRAQAGLSAVLIDDKLSYGCQLHAEYLARNAEAILKKNAQVNDEDVNLPGFTREGLRSAQQSLIFNNAPVPAFQIDDLIATAANRRFLLDPALQRIGFGCAHDLGRGWRCVLDLNGGRGDTRVIVYPAPKQADVPTVGFEAVKDKPDAGFPISVIFPHRTSLRNPQAQLKDGATTVNVQIVVLDKPQPIVGVVPLAPLQPGRTYTATVSVVNNGIEWRETWQFTTKK